MMKKWTVALLVLFMVFAGFSGTSPFTIETAAAAGNIISNGDFSNGTTGWSSYAPAKMTVAIDQGRAKMTITTAGTNTWDNMLQKFNNGGVVAGQSYTISFDAQAASNRTVTVALQNGSTTIFSQQVNLTTSSKNFSFTFTPAQGYSSTDIKFMCGGNGTTWWLDNVSVTESSPPPSGNLINNGDFSNGMTGWSSYAPANMTAAIDQGRAKMTITNAGTNTWDNMLQSFGNGGVTAGQQYTITFSAQAASNRTVTVGLQNGSTTIFSQQVSLTASNKNFSFTFTPAQSYSSTAIKFMCGGNGTTWWLDNVSVVSSSGGGQFSVQGTKIYAPNGQQFVAKGVNVNGPYWPWSRDTLQDVNLITNIWKFNTVRVAMFPRLAPICCSNNTDLDAIVDAFTSKNVVTMLENHDLTGKYPKATRVAVGDGSYYPSKQELINFWVDKANKYKNNSYVWFNLINEPGRDGLSNSASAAEWKSVHGEIVSAIRATGANNIIVIDDHGWGQAGGYKNGDSDSAVATHGTWFTQNYNNIVFSLHMYDSWDDSGGQARLQAYANSLHNKGLAFLIGEYGINLSNNTGWSATKAMFNVAVPGNIGRLAWSWDSQDDGYDLTTGTTKGAGWQITPTGGSTPTNMSWMGTWAWQDTHGTLNTPIN